VAGTLLIVLSVFFLVFYFRGFDRLAFLVKVGVAVLFVGPLLSSGLALLPRDEANAAPEAA
jgi:O-antigen/teichoic acid export membrane protein